MNETRLAAVATVTTVVLWGSAFVVIRAVGDSLSPGAMAFVRLFVGTVLLLATVPFVPQAVSELAAAPTSALLGVLFLGVGPTAIAFTTWAYALARTDAGRMAASTLAVPAIAVLVSWLALGEVPTALGLAGGVLCLLGVTLSRRRPGGPPQREAGTFSNETGAGASANSTASAVSTTCTALP